MARKEGSLIKPPPLPQFSQRRKIILVVAGFFLLGSFLAQVSPLASKLEKVFPKAPS